MESKWLNKSRNVVEHNRNNLTVHTNVCSCCLLSHAQDEFSSFYMLPVSICMVKLCCVGIPSLYTEDKQKPFVKTNSLITVPVESCSGQSVHVMAILGEC